MTTRSPKIMEAPEAAEALERALIGAGRRGRPQELTIADAAARSGLPLRDAERGLHALLSEYRGHLRVTSEGDLLFRFPHGLTRPWETRTRLRRAVDAIGRFLLATLKLVVRAWIAIVLLAYVAIFVAIMIALLFTRQSGDSRRDHRGGGFDFGSFLLFRILFDALFWTFHPFSPVIVTEEPAYRGARRWEASRRKKDETPFYEKVNRFFFGPDAPRPEPRAMERRILAEIRAQKGRIGLADVMRVTGLPRDEADPLMARLLLDYDGDVDVSEEGGIIYRFAELRKSVEAGGNGARGRLTTASAPKPVWAERLQMTPLTGNTLGSNILIGALNGFNLLASLWAIGNALTLEKVQLLVFHGVPLEKLPAGGTAIALGFVPLIFSIALFVLPLVRALFRPLKARRIARENGRRAVLREVLRGVRRGGVKDDALQRAYSDAAGREPSSREITRQVVALGGDVDLEAGDGVRYRFPDLEVEAVALQAEREAAAEEEARPGKVIFSSEE